MKIAVVCANGKAGQLIVKEAVDRGLDVTAFVRGENKSAAPKAVIKDLFEITKDDLAPFDAVSFRSVSVYIPPKGATSLTSGFP